DYYTKKDLKSDSYLLFEVANKLVRNSYISLFSALKIHGVIFQYYGGIYSVANKPVEKTVSGIKFIYKKIKQDVLFNDMGIIQKNLARVAGIERSICDALYFFPKLGLENINNVSKSRIMKIANIYNNKLLLKRIKKLMDK
ncbi:MAG: hypothetical protein U9Q63_01165, partial [Patescibacteria group bacterium]|nr:hypothetical protein [Patescibacteria group bacterium]